MKATKEQKQLIHVNAPTRDIKEELVQWATDCNDNISCNDLSFEQANEIMHKLGLHRHKKPTSPFTGNEEVNDFVKFNIKNQQHKYILSLLRQIGWTKGHERYGVVADMDRFGNWLQSDKSPVKKPLNSQTKEETTKIINALESMMGKKYDVK